MVVRVLVVEDDLIQQQVLACFLESRDFYVETARTGLEAIQKLRVGKYRIVLLDYLMPDIDGLAAARVIKRDNGNGSPWLIALTSNVAEMVRAEAELIDVFDAMAEKPWQPDLLLEILKRYQQPRPPFDPEAAAGVSLLRDHLERMQAKQEGGAAAAPEALEKPRVLLIDGDGRLLSMFQDSLEAMGYVVDTAKNREEGLQSIAAHRYQYVLSDYLKLSRFCGTPDAFAAIRA